MKLKITNSKIELTNRGIILLLSCFSIVLSCKDNTKYEAIETKESVFLTGKLIPDNHFLGDNNCKECHKDEFKDWQGSHHDKAMQIADSITVLANFKDETLTSQGITSRFYKKDTDFYVNTEGPDGKYHDLL